MVIWTHRQTDIHSFLYNIEFNSNIWDNPVHITQKDQKINFKQKIISKINKTQNHHKLLLFHN